MKRATASVRTVAYATLVVAEGEFDLAAAKILGKALLEATGAVETNGRIIVDMTAVTFADSSAIGTVVGAQKRASARGVDMSAVLPLGSTVRKVFEATGVTQAIAVHATLGDAVAAAVEAMRAQQLASDLVPTPRQGGDEAARTA